MKRITIAALAMAFFAVSCSDSKPKEETQSQAIQQEVQALDSVANQVENATQDIEQAAEKLDALLEDL